MDIGLLFLALFFLALGFFSVFRPKKLWWINKVTDMIIHSWKYPIVLEQKIEPPTDDELFLLRVVGCLEILLGIICLLIGITEK